MNPTPRPTAPSTESPEAPNRPHPDPVPSLRRFHLGGPDRGEVGLPKEHSFLPALSAPFSDPGRLRTDYPYFVRPAEAPDAVGDLGLPAALDALVSDGEATRILRDNIQRLEGHLRQLGATLDGPTDARELFSRATTAMVKSLALPAPEGQRLDEALGAVADAIHAGSRFVPLTPRTPLDLLSLATERRQHDARVAYTPMARGHLDRLAGAVGKEHRRRIEEERPGVALGALGDRFVDPARLSGVVGAPRGSIQLPPERQEELVRAHAALTELLAAPEQPMLCGPAELLDTLGSADDLTSWQVFPSADPCLEAAQRFDQRTADLAQVLRAVRLVRLWSEGLYDPGRDDAWLEHFDWMAFGREELALLPAVVVLLPAGDATGPSLASLSELLSSGRPVDVVILTAPGRGPGAETGEDRSETPATRIDPGSFALGHRTVFVSQTSVARPGHMLEAFERSLAAACPGLHVVGSAAETSPEDPRHWLRPSAAVEGRAQVLFRYDPDAGQGWARRLDISGNPAPEEDWASGDLATTGAEPSAIPFTFADYALLEPSWHCHFHPVKGDADAPDLVPVAEYLELSLEAAGPKIPFVWAIDASQSKGGQALHRMAVSRSLASTCRQRLDRWRALQELAGVKSELADNAAATARQEAEERARQEFERTAAAHAEEIERIRRDAVRAAAEQITTALLDVDPAMFAGTPAGAAMLPTGSVDDIAATLLGMVSLEGISDGAAPPSTAVEGMAAQLLDLIQTEDPTTD